GIHAAVTRRRQDGQPGPNGWYPEQRVTLEKALLAYSQPLPTSNQPPLSPGSPADLIVLDQDPFDLDPQELWKLKPSLTMLEGEIVFSR
ncbi:MAG TPA: amidohydrolase family protein, partial [Chloroflexi bacterium]|nr:amidohydrolase family protein [Chloroflexota bacterium]